MNLIWLNELGLPSCSKRPSHVKVTCESIRNEISDIRFNLDGNQDTKQVYLNEDLPQVLNDRRSHEASGESCQREENPSQDYWW